MTTKASNWDPQSLTGMSRETDQELPMITMVSGNRHHNLIVSLLTMCKNNTFITGRNIVYICICNRTGQLFMFIDLAIVMFLDYYLYFRLLIIIVYPSLTYRVGLLQPQLIRPLPQNHANEKHLENRCVVLSLDKFIMIKKKNSSDGRCETRPP